jgi:hypothetical protein
MRLADLFGDHPAGDAWHHDVRNQEVDRRAMRRRQAERRLGEMAALARTLSR